MLETIARTAVVIGLTGFAAAQSKSPRQIAQEAYPSVALLVMEDSNGQPTALGSGFVFRNGLIVTNRHVIAGATTGYARLVGQSAKYEISGTVAVDVDHDLAIVAVDGLFAPALNIGDSEQVAVGDEVYAVGNPQGLEGTFSHGIVSAIRRVGDGSILQITAPISPGSSGGPILDAAGKLVGIAVATFGGGQNLNLAIPSLYLKSLSAKISSDVRPLSLQRSSPNKRSAFFDLGGPSVKGVVGENLLWAFGYSEIGAGLYTFSLRNQLREPVTHVDCLVVFFDARQKPVDVDRIVFEGVIPGGLAKRATGGVDNSVRRLARRVEVRVLDFRIAN